MHAEVKKERRDHKKLLKSLMNHFKEDEDEIEEEEKEESGKKEYHKTKSNSSTREKNYPKEYYDKDEIKQEPNKKFYPPYDGERDEYEKVSLKGSPWTNWKEPPERGNNGEAVNGSESKACDGRKGEVERVSETLEKPHKASKADRKKMAMVVISAKMRKRKNAM